MSKPIKAIVCGAGDMARKHIEAYRKLDNVEIAAVASRSIPRAAALSAGHDIPRYYDDIDDAFGREKADIASVCVPTAHHPAITAQAMAKGMHVITEKPIALTVTDAQEMIDRQWKKGDCMSASSGKLPKLPVGFHTGDAEAGFDGIEPICETMYVEMYCGIRYGEQKNNNTCRRTDRSASGLHDRRALRR